MTTATDVQSAIAAQATEIAAANAKTDAVLALLASVQTQLAALQIGGGASSADLDAIIASINSNTQALATEAAKEDAALPADARAPAPGA